jgi:hypothetical protein
MYAEYTVHMIHHKNKPTPYNDTFIHRFGYGDVTYTYIYMLSRTHYIRHTCAHTTSCTDVLCKQNLAIELHDQPLISENELLSQLYT